MKFMRIALLDTVLLSPLINACENYFWEKIIFREKLSPSDKNLIFDSGGQNLSPTVIRSLPSLKSHDVGQVALRYPRIFSSYFILIKESTFWWITFQHETVWFQQHTFMATSWQWTNPHLFIFTILWLLRLSTSWISENQKINRIRCELQQWLPMEWLIKTKEYGGILVVDLIHLARYQKWDIL